MLIAKRTSGALRFSENSRPRPSSNHRILSDGLLSIRTFAGNFTPTMGGNRFSFQLFKKTTLARRRKLISFLVVEVSAIAVFVLAGATALAFKPTDPSILLSIDIITVVAASAVAILPILFFAIRPILPRGER